MARIWIVLSVLAVLAGHAMAQEVRTRDHYLSVISNDPAIAGQRIKIYVRERATATVMYRGAGDKVVLFVHGGGTPAEVGFDVPFQDYSWMGYLAAIGYDTFAVDMTGYGRSTRPPQMNDKCNLSPRQQKAFKVDCPPTYPGALTNIASDWGDLAAAVAFVRKLRHVAKVSLIGWSLGGPRAGGWAALHPEQVAKLILLAPAYNPSAKAEAPPLPVPGAAFNTQSHEEFIANWVRQAPCPGQYDPAAAESVWSAMLESDPVGAAWTPAVRRAPNASSGWGWTSERIKAMTTPTLVVSGETDKQANPEGVREFYAALGSGQKVFVSLVCSSHNVPWEKNHMVLFKASREWLEKTTVNGTENGELKLGE